MQCDVCRSECEWRRDKDGESVLFSPTSRRALFDSLQYINRVSDTYDDLPFFTSERLEEILSKEDAQELLHRTRVFLDIAVRRYRESEWCGECGAAVEEHFTREGESLGLWPKLVPQEMMRAAESLWDFKASPLESAVDHESIKLEKDNMEYSKKNPPTASPVITTRWLVGVGSDSGSASSVRHALKMVLSASGASTNTVLEVLGW